MTTNEQLKIEWKFGDISGSFVLKLGMEQFNKEEKTHEEKTVLVYKYVCFFVNRLQNHTKDSVLEYSMADIVYDLEWWISKN